MTIELSEDARVWLREQGYDKMYGARTMGRVIQTELKARSPTPSCSASSPAAASPTSR